MKESPIDSIIIDLILDHYNMLSVDHKKPILTDTDFDYIVAYAQEIYYKKIIEAGTHLAPSIKVAEASKIIENVQRDVNISLMNELAIIFNKMEIDTTDVLKASSTKWNFLKFNSKHSHNVITLFPKLFG